MFYRATLPYFCLPRHGGSPDRGPIAPRIFRPRGEARREVFRRRQSDVDIEFVAQPAERRSVRAPDLELLANDPVAPFRVVYGVRVNVFADVPHLAKPRQRTIEVGDAVATAR